MTRIQRHGMSADRPCANVISVLLGKEPTRGQRNLVREAFVNALTHPVNEVQWYAVWGIDARAAVRQRPRLHGDAC